ncbi:hypothetical protein [Streptomyces sp. NPDC086519]|uniref:hypothetical protein n=1 Tax=Streptomyces sp. NPDC086519 TaxID=3154863 RepID=UPI00342E9566
MPSYGEQPQTTYLPTPLPPQYGQAPVPAFGQHVVPLPQNTVVYPSTAGIDGVVVVPGPAGQQVAYYTPPPAPAPQPLVSPLLIKAALVAFIVGISGVGLYFLMHAIVELLHALATIGLIGLAGLVGFIVLKMFSIGSGSRSRGDTINVNAKGRARVQVHTGRGHNRGRRR